jgi:hypothetical protein
VTGTENTENIENVEHPGARAHRQVADLRTAAAAGNQATR